MAKKGLSHIALKVRDLKKTEDFYVGILGLKVAFRHPPSMIFLTTPGSGDLLNFVKTAQRVNSQPRPRTFRLQSHQRGTEKARSKIQKARHQNRRPPRQNRFLHHRSQRLSTGILLRLTWRL